MYKQIIQDSIDYIEDNLKCDVTAQELSQRAGFSLFHYYRLFHAVVGMPVMQYILRRRLLNAIYEISSGYKMIDVALEYGFETHAGFYKAFQREFSCTPSQYLKKYKVKKPYRMNVIKEEHVMVTHKKIAELLPMWGLEKEKISDIYHGETGNQNMSAYYVGDKYVLKFSTNLGKVKNQMIISKKLEEAGLFAATPLKTLDEKEYVVDGELYFYVTRRLEGGPLSVAGMYEGDYETKARYVGEVIGQLSIALALIGKDVDFAVQLNDANIYDGVVNWAIPALKGKLDIPSRIQKAYEEHFAKIYVTLPRQVVHRDPNPGNIIMAGEKWGFIDFELSERNVRIFDPCYAATAILSESFEHGNKEKLAKWVQIYKNIINGYDDVAKLTDEEREAVNYVVLSNQLIATAWFADKEKYQDLFEVNKKMTEWIMKELL